ncbi:MAG: zinc ribbon domain-containing protein [Thermodesulfobacteriota bacterium]
MPIYEYRCDSCGREFEEWQKFSDPVVERCSCCGGRTRRLISQSSFVLKGTGWYVTDYGRGSSCPSSKPAEKKESSSEANSSSSGTSSDT